MFHMCTKSQRFQPTFHIPRHAMPPLPPDLHVRHLHPSIPHRPPSRSAFSRDHTDAGDPWCQGPIFVAPPVGSWESLGLKSIKVHEIGLLG